MFADGDHRVRFGLDSGNVAENQVQNVGADSENFGLGNLVLELVVELVPVALLVDQHVPDVFGLLGGLHDPEALAPFHRVRVPKFLTRWGKAIGKSLELNHIDRSLGYTDACIVWVVHASSLCV